jgi:hypothetical protein
MKRFAKGCLIDDALRGPPVVLGIDPSRSAPQAACRTYQTYLLCSEAFARKAAAPCRATSHPDALTPPCGG